MRKVFKMEELDCAHCAARMEEGIGNLEGVEKASVNFLSQKMILEVADGTDMEVLKPQIASVVHKVDSHCQVIFS